MDVYDPTMFALRQLYDKVSKGGYIIIDDWALAGVRTAVMEFWTERGLKPEIKQVPNSTPIYWIKE
jgi:O-methyltransferase